MKKVVLIGDEKTVNAIIAENRIRVSRGLIQFAPADAEGSKPSTSTEDEEPLTDSKEVNETADDKGASIATDTKKRTLKK